jgi:hypothetical protein
MFSTREVDEQRSSPQSKEIVSKAMLKKFLELSSVKRCSLLIFPQLTTKDLRHVIVVGPWWGCGTSALQLFMSRWVKGIVQVGITAWSGYLPYHSPIIFSTIVRLSSVVGGIDYELDYDCYLWLWGQVNNENIIYNSLF